MLLLFVCLFIKLLINRHFSSAYETKSEISCRDFELARAGAEEVTVGVGSGTFELDASSSVDPDGLTGSIDYEWTCEAEESDVSRRCPSHGALKVCWPVIRHRTQGRSARNVFTHFLFAISGRPSFDSRSLWPLLFLCQFTVYSMYFCKAVAKQLRWWYVQFAAMPYWYVSLCVYL